MDGDLLKWALTTAGVAIGWAYDRLDRRAQRRAEQSEARRTVRTQAQTIAAKNAELAALRESNEQLLGALLSCVREHDA